MIDLSRLDKYVDKKIPSNFEMTLFYFSERGISFNEFCELPIPYIVGVLNTFEYVEKRKDEERQSKK